MTESQLDELAIEHESECSIWSLSSAFKAGYRARDAEATKLRETLQEVIKLREALQEISNSRYTEATAMDLIEIAIGALGD